MIISLTVGMKIYRFFTAHSLERDPVMMEKSTRFSLTEQYCVEVEHVTVRKKSSKLSKNTYV